MEVLPTFLQIDLQNLYYGARNRGQRLDFEKIWDFFSSRGSEFLTDAVIYMIRGDDFDSSKFESKLKTLGYSLRIKETVRVIRDGKTIYKQSNHDVTIALDCIDRIKSYEKWILMSGDGDFTDLARHLKQNGKQVEIWGFKECYNSSLEAYADKMYFIDEDFFLKKSKISVFGFNRGGLEF
jgi:uncharacterized LabA/DUF88 family protein